MDRNVQTPTNSNATQNQNIHEDIDTEPTTNPYHHRDSIAAYSSRRSQRGRAPMMVQDPNVTDNVTYNPPSSGQGTSRVSAVTHASIAEILRTRKTSGGSPTPYSTPTNSPEKPKGSPGPATGAGGIGTPERRTPSSPPTPFHKPLSRSSSSSGHRVSSTTSSPTNPRTHHRQYRSMSYLAVPSSSTTGINSTYTPSRSFTSTYDPFTEQALAERQAKLREHNQARIRAWEKHYAGLPGEREGGNVDVRCRTPTVVDLVAMREKSSAAREEAEEMVRERKPVKFGC